MKKTPRRDPAHVASRLHDRAVAARGRGRPTEAAASCRRSLHLLERATGPDHPDVANVLNTLGSLHEDQGDYVAAAKLYQRSVRIMAKVRGDADVERIRLQSLGDNRGHFGNRQHFKFLTAMADQEFRASPIVHQATPEAAEGESVNGSVCSGKELAFHGSEPDGGQGRPSHAEPLSHDLCGALLQGLVESKRGGWGIPGVSCSQTAMGMGRLGALSGADMHFQINWGIYSLVRASQGPDSVTD